MKNCEVIRDQKTGDSLQYAFVEFYDQPACEQAYFKMDNVLIGGLIHRIKDETYRQCCGSGSISQRYGSGSGSFYH